MNFDVNILSLFLEIENFESGSQGYIASANYPGYYPTNKIYVWTITVPEGKIIEVTFQELDIEYSSGCTKDFLKAYDGRGVNDALLNTYCGRSRPASFRTSGRYLYLYFRSDVSGTSRGFRIYWRAVDGPTTTRPPIVTTTTEPEGMCRYLVLELLWLVLDSVLTLNSGEYKRIQEVIFTR